MSFTRFNYDEASSRQRLKQATGTGRYYLNVPGPGNNSCYMEDPQIRLGTFAANNMNVVGGHPIDIDSDLSGRGRMIAKYCTHDMYPMKKNITTTKINYQNCKSLGTDQTRATHPARNYRALEQTLVQPLYLNPQENTCFHFENNLNTRLLERDSFVPKLPCL